MMKTLVVDDQLLFREGLVSFLTTLPGFKVIGEADSCARALEVARVAQPDLILLDIHLLDGPGLEVIPTLLAEIPHTKIICLADEENHEYLLRVIRDGAHGYLLKDTGFSNLAKAIQELENEELVIPKEISQRALLKFSRMDLQHERDSILNNLTPRERDVLKWICKNASNRQIAQELIISENTVRIHVHNLLKKLELKNRREIRTKYDFILKPEDSDQNLENVD